LQISFGEKIKIFLKSFFFNNLFFPPIGNYVQSNEKLYHQKRDEKIIKVLKIKNKQHVFWTIDPSENIYNNPYDFFDQFIDGSIVQKKKIKKNIFFYFLCFFK
jgi:hypothetical protein